jgi:serine/threonine protein kinase
MSDDIVLRTLDQAIDEGINRFDHLNMDSNKLAAKFEEQSIALEAAYDVNRHLNDQVEKLASDVETLEREQRDLLHRLKLALRVNSQEVDSSSSPSTTTPDTTIKLSSDNNTTNNNNKTTDTAVVDIILQELRDQLDICNPFGLWRVDPSEVFIEEEFLKKPLGQGTFCTTYLGIFRGSPVAVKKFQIDPPSSSPSSLGEKKQQIDSFVREAVALMSIKSPHLVGCYGMTIAPTECQLLLEYLPGGSLKEYLYGKEQNGTGSGNHNNKGSLVVLRPSLVPAQSHPASHTTPKSLSPSSPAASWLPLSARLKLLLDIASGMMTLEVNTPHPVLHRDLKPSNVLLTSRESGCITAKVSDFGLAKLYTPQTSQNLTNETGTYLYMSPEMMRHESYTLLSDVWSFGCLAVEVISGKRPYSQHPYLTAVSIALKVAEGELNPLSSTGGGGGSVLPEGLPSALLDVLFGCFEPDPVERPTFGVIVSVLRNVIDSRVVQTQESSGSVEGGGLLARWWRS